MPTSHFTTRLRRAATGSSATRLSFIGNFEVEEQWARGETTLPRVGSAQGQAIVNRMDEFALWLGAADDVVFLKSDPDSDYLAALRDLGFDLPRIRIVGEPTADRNITEDLIADEAAADPEKQLADTWLLPHSVSVQERELADRLGLRIAAPDAETCKRVNSKVYSRRLADEHGIRQAEGATATDIDELSTLVAVGHRMLADGRTVVIKEAFGVSGKGISVIDTPAKLDRLAAIVSRRAAKNDGRAAFCLEEWLPKAQDLNYQFTIDRDGTAVFDAVKVAVTRNGAHRGHSYPAQLHDHHVEEVEAAMGRIAADLAADGYFGVVGVDALIDTAGTLYPVLEINARLNMATYQAAIDEIVAADRRRARAKHFELRLDRPIPYRVIHDVIGDAAYSRDDPNGLIVNNFATVNAAFELLDGCARAPGRLYGVLLGDTEEALDRMDELIGRRLAAAGFGEDPQ